MFRVSGIAAVAAYAGLAGLVAAGKLSGTDQWAVDHAMPGARFGGGKPSLLDALIPLRHVQWHGTMHVIAEIVTLPAALVPATILLGVCCLRIGGIRALALGGIFVVANAVEELTKSTLSRPPLYHGSLHLAAFDASYPSGHTVRAAFLAAGVAIAWPRFRFAAAASAVCVVAMLEIGGFHVPSDLVGGALLSVALLAGLRGRL